MKKTAKKTAAKKPSIKNASKPTAPAKKEPKVKVDASADTRKSVLKVLEDGGFKGTEKSNWWRFNVGTGKVSLQSKGPQVHFRRFDFKHAGVEQVSDKVAKEKNLGSVRQIMWMDRQTPAIARAAIATAIASVKAKAS